MQIEMIEKQDIESDFGTLSDRERAIAARMFHEGFRIGIFQLVQVANILPAEFREKANRLYNESRDLQINDSGRRLMDHETRSALSVMAKRIQCRLEDGHWPPTVDRNGNLVPNE